MFKQRTSTIKKTKKLILNLIAETCVKKVGIGPRLPLLAFVCKCVGTDEATFWTSGIGMLAQFSTYIGF